MSEEHIWSDWMRDLMPPQTHYIEEMTISDGPQKPIAEHKTRERQGRTYTKRVKVVCAKCNNEWMSRIDETAKPYIQSLMTDSFCALTASVKQLVAQWITLKMFVLEHEQTFRRAPDYVHSQNDRTAFMEHGAIPRGVRIWIGRGNEPEWAARVHRFSGGMMLSPTPFLPTDFDITTRTKNVQSIAWGIRNLRVFVFSTTNSDVYGKLGISLPQFVGLWPLTPPDTVWPTTVTVTDREMFKVSVSLQRLYHMTPLQV